MNAKPCTPARVDRDRDRDRGTTHDFPWARDHTTTHSRSLSLSLFPLPLPHANSRKNDEWTRTDGRTDERNERTKHGSIANKRRGSGWGRRTTLPARDTRRTTPHYRTRTRNVLWGWRAARLAPDVGSYTCGRYLMLLSFSFFLAFAFIFCLSYVFFSEGELTAPSSAFSRSGFTAGRLSRAAPLRPRLRTKPLTQSLSSRFHLSHPRHPTGSQRGSGRRRPHISTFSPPPQPRPHPQPPSGSLAPSAPESRYSSARRRGRTGSPPPFARLAFARSV